MQAQLAAPYKVGGSVTLTATANNGYKFAYWGSDQTDSTSPKDVTYTAGTPITVVANFNVKVTTTAPEGGTITFDPALDSGYAKINTSYKLTLTGVDATKNTISWEGATADASDPTKATATFSDVTTVKVTATAKDPGTTDPEDPATPAAKKPTVSVDPAEGGYVLAPDGKTKLTNGATVETTGTAIKLTAVANEGYEFASWMLDNSVVTGAKAEHTFAYADIKDGTASKIVARFAKKGTTTPEDPKVDEVIAALPEGSAEDIAKMEPEEAQSALDTAFSAVTSTGTDAEQTAAADALVEELAKPENEDALAKMDALMAQAPNGIQIGDATVNVTVDAPAADPATPKDEKVTVAPKFAGLSLLAIKERAEITMTPTQRPASTFKNGDFTGGKLWIDLVLKMKKGGKESQYTGKLPKYVKIELTVPTPAANSKFMNIFHSDNDKEAFKPSNATNIIGRNYFTKKDNGDGTTTITFYLRKFSDVVFSDEAVKSTSSSTSSYRGGGGGGAGFSSYVITATAGAGGTISSPGETRYNAGSSVTYTITPNAGYVVDKVLVDGKKEVALTNGTYTFRLLDQPYTISATFKPVSGGTAAQPSAPAAAAPNPSTGDSWFSHLFF